MSFVSPYLRQSTLSRSVQWSRKPPWSLTGVCSSYLGRYQRWSSSSTETQEQSPAIEIQNGTHWKDFKASYVTERNVHHLPFPVRRNVLQSKDHKGQVEGFLNRIVVISKEMTFAHIDTPKGSVQLLCLKKPALNQQLKSIPIGSAIRAIGDIREKARPKTKRNANEKAATSTAEERKIPKPTETTNNDAVIPAEEIELHLTQVDCLNSFISSNEGNPADPAINYPPESRHLQIRFDAQLSKRLKIRANAVKTIRNELHDFVEVETPILFKSTPEGAREFLVPTRRKGFAYALPQSPQQYKQILMASGISRYFQFARCFRDEDLRADRQPEFTQLDLEMAWADGSRVMATIENIIFALYMRSNLGLSRKDMIIGEGNDSYRVPRITYHEAMSSHGSDKPDLRIDGKISEISHVVPLALQKMLTGLEEATFDAWRFRAVPEVTPRKARAFIQQFLDSPDGREFRDNPDGAPGVFVFDERAPLEGLQAFGHEGAETLKEHWLKHEGELSSGDLIIVQARKAGPFYGGSTALGKLRLAINKAAIAEGHIEQKPGHHYLWVTDFPMFTPDNETDPGQGGTAGFSATHHPFTAPNSVKDLELLRTDPLAAKADHYDLVVNGVELGGGSRRIHNVEVQKYVMRDILKMSEERMNDFTHLFDALASGCPPHAGFAIGFDRLIAVLTGRESVKDVIAFPKSSKGEDMMVKSPSQISDKELATYHLQLNKDGQTIGDGQPVPTAAEDSKVADPVTKQ